MRHIVSFPAGNRARRALALGCALLTSAAWAQSDPASADTVKLDSYVVTGSNLPLAGETPVAPVTIITPAEIERTGVVSDLLQVIRKRSPQFTGNGNLGADNGNVGSGSTNGGSALALRNAATLVLVNGRRLAAAPVAASGGGVFVDVNAIPVSAISRVEILTDGASAIYGTDAVSGVVNIILKTDYQGGEVGARYAWTRNKGHYEEKSAWGVVGGQLGENGPRLTASYEWTKTEPIYNYQRPFANPSYGTTNFAGVIQVGDYDADGNFIGDPEGYYYLNPELDAPRAGATLAERGYDGAFDADHILRLFNLSEFVTMLIGNEKKVFTLSGDQKVGNLTLFGDLLFSRTNTISQLNAQPLTIQLEADDPNNILGRAVSVRNRFVEFPRIYSSDTDSIRGVLGAKGSLTSEWSWESAVNYSEGTQDFANHNLVRTAERIAAVNSGAINLFARSQPTEAVAGLLGSARGKFTSRLTSWDLKFVGTDLIQLPGGGLSLAAGTEVRKETLKATSDVDSQSETFAYDSGTTIDPFSEGRHITSLFAEVNLPLVGKANRVTGIYSADLTIAGRHERYSDTDNPTVPKVSLRYQPVDESLMFRATYSRSFAAPTLYELNAPTGIGFTNTIAEFGSNQANAVTLPVESLAPSRSTNYSAGVVWTPKSVKDLAISLDFFALKQTAVISDYDEPGVIDQVFHDVEVKGAASPYASLIRYGSATGPAISEPGQISALGLDNLYFVIPAASNLGTQKMAGFDLNLHYGLPLGAGKLTFDSTHTYYAEYKIQVAPGAPYTETAGLVTGLNGSIPRVRSYNVIGYELEPFTFELGHTFYTSMRETTWTPDFLPDYQQRIPSYSVFDVALSYDFKGSSKWLRGFKVTVGVNNIANRFPTKSATFDTYSNADITEFSPIGRLFYVTARYTF